jgi:hypothetical protein
VYTDDLKQVSKHKVEQTIVAKDQSDAERIVDRLRADLLPICEDPSASPPPSPSPGATPSKSSLPNTALTPSPDTPASPKPAVTPTPGESPLPSQSPEPGVDCRWPR